MSPTSRFYPGRGITPLPQVVGSNTATVSQYSNGNVSGVVQSGTGNTATVTQGM